VLKVVEYFLPLDMVLYGVFKKRVMLTGASGALVKKANIVSIALEHVLSTPQKHKKCYFYFKISISRFLNQCPGAPVNMTLKKKS
jgi:hypothetical protein